MPTPTKPYEVLRAEGKSHRTNAELEQRKDAESAMLTNVHMEPWPKLDKDALAEFSRVRSLLAIIGKDDALYEGAVNRYSEIKSECTKFQKAIKKQHANLAEVQKRLKAEEIDFMTFMDLSQNIYGNINSLDRQIQAKRKMLLDIEKENCMTIASALRSIPKKVEKKEATGMAAFLQQRNGS